MGGSSYKYKKSSVAVDAIAEPLENKERGDTVVMRWLALGITLLLGSQLSFLRVAQQTGTETPCPPQAPNSFCTLYVKDQNISSNIAFSPDGQLVAVAYRQDDPFKTIIRVWKINGQILYELQGHIGIITSISFSPDGKLLASSSLAVNPSGYGGGIKLWDISTGKEIRTLQPPNGVNGVVIAFSPNGKLLVTTSCILDPSLRSCAQIYIILWDPLTGAEVRQLRIPEMLLSRITSLAFVSDELLAVGGPEAIILLSVRVGRVERVLFGQSAFITISPDKRLLVSHNLSYIVDAWSMPDGMKLGSINLGRVLGLSFTPDGRFLAGGEIFPSPDIKDRHFVQIWRVGARIEDWQVARILAIPLPAIGSGVSDSIFSPTGDLIALGGYYEFSDAFVQLWYVRDLK